MPNVSLTKEEVEMMKEILYQIRRQTPDVVLQSKIERTLYKLDKAR